MFSRASMGLCEGPFVNHLDVSVNQNSNETDMTENLERWFPKNAQGPSINGRVGTCIAGVWDLKMDVSENYGTPKSSILIGPRVFHYKPSILGCFPIFGNIQIAIFEGEIGFLRVRLQLFGPRDLTPQEVACEGTSPAIR